MRGILLMSVRYVTKNCITGRQTAWEISGTRMFLIREGDCSGDKIAEAGHQKPIGDQSAETEGITGQAEDRTTETTVQPAGKEDKKIGQISSTENRRLNEEPKGQVTLSPPLGE
jgi:hypothetical protein